MLKKVRVADLRVGMYFARAEGSWLAHGLWRANFLISDAARLASLSSSGVRECWVDLKRGLDVASPDVAASERLTQFVTKVAPSVPASIPTSAVAVAGNSVVSELARAATICENARLAVGEVFSDIRLGRTPALAATRPIVEEITDSVFRRSGALLAVSRLKTKDDYTYMHSVSVCTLMVALSRELGFDEQQCVEAGFAGLLHDVGKALIPLEILNKPGKLTDAEFALVKTHPAKGHALLVACDITEGAALDVSLHHHEKVDGSGYPEGLAEGNISLIARMGAVCDVYDAVTSDRPYKSGWEPAKALTEMASWRGHFDRVMLAAFIKTMGVFPVGSLVRLESGRLAVVMESRRGSVRSPLVKVFYSATSSKPLEPQLVDLSARGERDKIARAEDNEKWAFSNLGHLCVG